MWHVRVFRQNFLRLRRGRSGRGGHGHEGLRRHAPYPSWALALAAGPRVWLERPLRGALAENVIMRFFLICARMVIFRVKTTIGTSTTFLTESWGRGNPYAKRGAGGYPLELCAIRRGMWTLFPFALLSSMDGLEPIQTRQGRRVCIDIV